MRLNGDWCSQSGECHEEFLLLFYECEILCYLCHGLILNRCFRSIIVRLNEESHSKGINLIRVFKGPNIRFNEMYVFSD